MLIRTDLLYIQRGPAGEVGFEGAVPVFIDAGGLDEAIGGDGTAIGGDDFLCGEQAEGDVFPFLIHPDGEGLILLQQLFEADPYLLPLIDEANIGGGDRHLLTGVGEGDFLRLGIQHHACGRCPFRNLVAAQVQGLRCGGPIAPSGQGSHQFSRLCVNNAIRGDDIFQSGDAVNSARLALHLILRLVEATGFCHMAEHLALLVDGDGAFLHRVVLGHGDNVLGAIHHKGYRLIVQNVTPGTLLLIQLVISKAQGLRQHEGPCGIRHEGVDVHGAGIVDVLHHPFAGIRIADLHGGAGQRDDLTGFGVPLFKADEGGKGGVIQDEIIGLAMLGNEHGEIRDEFLPLGASGLMHHIQAVWEGLRLGKTIGIRQQDIPFRLFGVLVTAGAGQVDLKFSPGLRLLDLHLIAGNGQRHSFCFRIGCIRLVNVSWFLHSVVFRGGAAFPGLAFVGSFIFFRLAGRLGAIFRNSAIFRCAGSGSFLCAFSLLFFRDGGFYFSGGLCFRRRSVLLWNGGLVGVLGNGNGAEHHILRCGHGDAVVFQREVPRLCAHRIDGFIQQVPLAGRDLTNGVIRAAGVLLGGECSPARSGVGVQQGFTFEHSVHCTIQGGVALGFPSDGIHLFHGDSELLQHIGKADAGGLAGVNGHLLGSGLDVSVR